MLHIEYRKNPYAGSVYEIRPESEGRIPKLRDMLEQGFQIENPAKTFAAKYKTDGYLGYSEEEIVAEAEKANILSEAWNFNGDGEASANVMMVLSRLMQLYVDAVLARESGTGSVV